MNNEGRDELEKIIQTIQEASQAIEDIADNELEKFENLNEGLQNTPMGGYLERNHEELQEAIGYLDDAVQGITEVIER